MNWEIRIINFMFKSLNSTFNFQRWGVVYFQTVFSINSIMILQLWIRPVFTNISSYWALIRSINNPGKLTIYWDESDQRKNLKSQTLNWDMVTQSFSGTAPSYIGYGVLYRSSLFINWDLLKVLWVFWFWKTNEFLLLEFVVV